MSNYQSFDKEKTDILYQKMSEFINDYFIPETMKPGVRLKPTRGKTGAKDTKFGGKPYIPEGFSYPTKNGDPLFLICQLNFAQIPHLDGFPESGLLQVYLYARDEAAMFESDCYQIFYHSDISGKNCYKNPFKLDKNGKIANKNVDYLGNILFKYNYPVKLVKLLKPGAYLMIKDRLRYSNLLDELASAYVEYRDVDEAKFSSFSYYEKTFIEAFNNSAQFLTENRDHPDAQPIAELIDNVYFKTQKDSPLDLYDDIIPLSPNREYKIETELIEMSISADDDISSALPDYDKFGACLVGGYPHFTQSDDRPPEYSELLLQIDSFDYSDGYENTVMWGDGGVINFFIKPENLKNADFSDILVGGDCA